MAHFYASIQGNRGEATRMGSETSGIKGHVRGWNFGVAVYGTTDENGNDYFEIRLTPGSNGRGHSKSLGTFTIADLKEA